MTVRRPLVLSSGRVAELPTADSLPVSAGGVTFGPAGAIAANNVQSAIEELDSEKQPIDAELTAIAGLTSAADKVPYFTGSGAAALATLTTAGRALIDDADAAAMRATLITAEMLTADRNYYVNGTTGNDSNDGLSSGAAFATIQKAVNVARGVFGGTYSITINVADGTYAENVVLYRHYCHSVKLLGNATTPANCSIAPSTGHPLACYEGYWLMEGFKMNPSVGSGFRVEGNRAHLALNGKFHVYAPGSACFVCRYGKLELSGATIELYSIAAASYVFFSQSGGQTHVNGCTLTVAQNMTGAAFGFVARWALLGFAATTINGSGTLTGKRYIVDYLAFLDTLGGGANYLPGTVAGTTANGGVYA